MPDHLSKYLPISEELQYAKQLEKHGDGTRALIYDVDTGAEQLQRGHVLLDDCGVQCERSRFSNQAELGSGRIVHPRAYGPGLRDGDGKGGLQSGGRMGGEELDG